MAADANGGVLSRWRAALGGAEPRSSSSPAPGVVLGEDLLPRVGGFTSRLAAAREREDVGRRRALQGEGEEFVGYRPYRSGEGLRRLDWDLLARLDRPYVRLVQQEVRESWWVAVDSSASMGVGAPHKLQSAAESVLAVVALGLRVGARVTLVAGLDGAVPERVELARTRDLSRAMDLLQGLEPNGDSGLTPLVGGSMATEMQRAGVGRVLLIGDLLDLEPTAILPLLAGRRRLHLGQVLAPEEWEPRVLPLEGDVTWRDPETGESRPAARLTGYHARLEAFVERWATLARTHGFTHHTWSSADPFEQSLPGLLR